MTKIDLKNVKFSFLTSELNNGKWITKKGNLGAIGKDAAWLRWAHRVFDFFTCQVKPHYSSINSARIITKLDASLSQTKTLSQQQAQDAQTFLDAFNSATAQKHRTEILALKAKIAQKSTEDFVPSSTQHVSAEEHKTETESGSTSDIENLESSEMGIKPGEEKSDIEPVRSLLLISATAPAPILPPIPATVPSPDPQVLIPARVVSVPVVKSKTIGEKAECCKIHFLTQSLSAQILKANLSDLSSQQIITVLMIMLNNSAKGTHAELLKLINEKKYELCVTRLENFYFLQKVNPSFVEDRNEYLAQRLQDWIINKHGWEKDFEAIKMIRAFLRFINKRDIGTPAEKETLLRQVLSAEKRLAPERILSPKDFSLKGSVHVTTLWQSAPSKESLKEVAYATSSNLLLSKPNGTFQCSNSYMQNIAVLQQFQSYFAGLQKHEKIEQLDRDILLVLSPLVPFEESELFLEKLNDQQLLELSDCLFCMTSELVSNHFRLQRNHLSPQHLKILLRLLELQEQILEKNQATSKVFKKYKFHVDYLYKGLNDPYYDLGAHATDLFSIYLRMDQRKKLAMSLTSSHKAMDNEYFLDELYGSSRNKDSSKFLQQRDLGSNCSIIGNARETYLYLTMLTAQEYCIFNNPPHYLLNPPGSFSAYSSEIRRDIRNDQPEIEKKLRQFKAADYLSINYAAHDKYFVIEPIGLKFFGLVEQTAYALDRAFIEKDGAISQHRNGKGRINQEAVRANVGENIVTVGGMDCNEIGSGSCGRFSYTGTLYSQDQIQNRPIKFEHLSSETSIDLQCMQTAPADRVRNTLIELTKRPYLTKITKREGRDWQRVFRLNLFRIGMIDRGLEASPSWIHQIIEIVPTFKLFVFEGHFPIEFFLKLLGDLVANIVASKWIGKDEKSLMANVLSEVLEELREDTIAQIFFENGPVIDATITQLLIAFAYAGESLALLGKESERLKNIRLQLLFLLCGGPKEQFHQDEWVTLTHSLDKFLESLPADAEKRNKLLNQIVALKYPGTKIDWNPTDNPIVFTSSDGRKQLNLRQCEIVVLNDIQENCTATGSFD